jgi:hypothetical protein
LPDGSILEGFFYLTRRCGLGKKSKISGMQLLIGLVVLILMSQIIPALLNASSNIAVMTGVAMIIGSGWAVYVNWEKIVTFIKEI